jgi:hypothetical protein
MNVGFSIKLNGGDIAFNGPSGLSLSDAGPVSIEAGIFTGSFTNFRTNQNIGPFGTFAFDGANIKVQPGNIVSADMISFILTAPGLTASQFTSFAIHFCTQSGTNCGPVTGFAASGPAIVPEASTSMMVFLGAGMFCLGMIIKRVRE